MLLEAPPITTSDPISPSSLFQRVWPSALLILALVVTLAWTALLGYGFVALVRMALEGLRGRTRPTKAHSGVVHVCAERPARSRGCKSLTMRE